MAGVVAVTASSADIPPHLAEELGAVVAPVGIDFRDGHFLDGRLSRPDFYRCLRETEELPTMSGVAAEAYVVPATLDYLHAAAFFRRTSRRCRRAVARPSQLTERPAVIPLSLARSLSKSAAAGALRLRPCRLPPSVSRLGL